MAPLWAERVRSQLRGPAEHTAEEATPGELRRSAFILVLMLIALVVLVVPVLKDLPLGRGTRTGIFAWLLVALALYWMWAGMGYRPLLLCQLLFFSAAAALISAKLLMVAVSIEGLVIMWVCPSSPTSPARSIEKITGSCCTAISWMTLSLARWRKVL